MVSPTTPVAKSDIKKAQVPPISLVVTDWPSTVRSSDISKSSECPLIPVTAKVLTAPAEIA